jgi:hypothetical protein
LGFKKSAARLQDLCNNNLDVYSQISKRLATSFENNHGQHVPPTKIIECISKDSQIIY